MGNIVVEGVSVQDFLKELSDLGLGEDVTIYEGNLVDNLIVNEANKLEVHGEVGYYYVIAEEVPRNTWESEYRIVMTNSHKIAKDYGNKFER